MERLQSRGADTFIVWPSAGVVWGSVSSNWPSASAFFGVHSEKAEASILHWVWSFLSFWPRAPAPCPWALGSSFAMSCQSLQATLNRSYRVGGD